MPAYRQPPRCSRGSAGPVTRALPFWGCVARPISRVEPLAKLRQRKRHIAAPGCLGQTGLGGHLCGVSRAKGTVERGLRALIERATGASVGRKSPCVRSRRRDVGNKMCCTATPGFPGCSQSPSLFRLRGGICASLFASCLFSFISQRTVSISHITQHSRPVLGSGAGSCF